MLVKCRDKYMGNGQVFSMHKLIITLNAHALMGVEKGEGGFSMTDVSNA